MAELTMTRTLEGDVKAWNSITRRDEPRHLKQTFKFTWQGGPYIEVSYLNRSPIEVINVWDYATGKATIDFTREGLKSAVTTWIDNYSTEDPYGSVHALLQDSTNWYL